MVVAGVTLPVPTSAFIRSFMARQGAGGVLLMGAAVLALIVANSPVAPAYFAALDVHLGRFSILHWINDGLMAIFFLLVGLEIKREALDGELATWAQRALPGLAAVGGMVVPAIVYLAFNLGPKGEPRGWAIPVATDIAFALGVLSMLGSRVAVSLKVFLTTLAVIDDLGAVLIIGLFYATGLNGPALAGSAGAVAVLIALNRIGVTRLWPYLSVGVMLWALVHLSGVHATLAGVALALAIPLRTRTQFADNASPLLRLEKGLHPWVTYLIIPIFGFANAGVSLAGLSLTSLNNPIPLGVALGLFLGKQLGVFSFAWAAIRLRLAALPEGAGWKQLYGVALLCGIGFTMSLFIGLLAFADMPLLQDQARIGVILGSVVSAIAGALLLRR
jgi:Na+:H+ antiporter, NhaA family